MHDAAIQLRGVSVHNLKSVDLDIERNSLTVFCGVSGSGKTSMALDTLYAEGQRRYIESFSAYTRQILERLEKPTAERIEGIAPAISVTRKGVSQSSRTTVGTATETTEYLRLLFAKLGQAHCPTCKAPIRRDSLRTVTRAVRELPEACRIMVTFPIQLMEASTHSDLRATLIEQGFLRIIVGDRMLHLEQDGDVADLASHSEIFVVVDRIKSDQEEIRIRDSIETCFDRGQGRCTLFAESGLQDSDGSNATTVTVDGRTWFVCRFSTLLRCETCEYDFPQLEPRLFSFNSPLGACTVCEGAGTVMDMDMELIIPDPTKSVRGGAIAAWNSPSFLAERDKLVEIGDEIGLPVDTPVADLTQEQKAILEFGDSTGRFVGMRAFFGGSDQPKMKMPLRVFLSRFQSPRPCSGCNGSRLNRDASGVTVAGASIAEICQMKIGDCKAFFDTVELTDWQQQVTLHIRDQIQSRLGYLSAVGLGYLSLDRELRTLSSGETQRVSLTTALGSSLVNMLYVLDEPTVGLHPRDVDHLVETILRLRDRKNTVVVVEHEEAVFRSADTLVEFGPDAGEKGGEITFEGTLDEMCEPDASLTGEYLAGRRGIASSNRRNSNHGRVRLKGARGNNLKNIEVEFPLGLLCVVTGVSGAGKSTLVQDTLYGALCIRKRKQGLKPLDYDDVFGDGQIDDVILVDQAPIGKSPRSNPVTYIKAFDEIRNVFAETLEARTHNYSASHFSFNVDGGRCTECQGEGQIRIDMQFLADVFMTCRTCNGTRFRREILEVRYRGRTIADVLNMTVREAFSFFRGRGKVQAKLKRLIDVGLDYLRLGQPANTLSSGEAQRLRLAAHMNVAKRSRTLFLLDEPTTGLHFADVVQLLDCFDALLNMGHSVIVVEHNLQLMKAADYIIDLGPGAGDEGGEVVACGTPEEISENPASQTGIYLRTALENDRLDVSDSEE